MTATRRRGPGAVVSHRFGACRRRYAWGRRGARSCRYSRSLLVDRLVGVGGRTLGEAWNRSPPAYLGTTVPGFPNFFILLGPNSIRINSVIFSLEAQIDYVMEALKTMEKGHVRCIEVSPDPLADYPADCDRRSIGSVWTDGGCTAYYLDEHGRNFAIYAGFASEYRRRTRPFDPDPYELVGVA